MFFVTKASLCFRLDSHPDRLTFSQYLSLFFISSSSLSSESIVSLATPPGGPLPASGNDVDMFRQTMFTGRIRRTHSGWAGSMQPMTYRLDTDAPAAARYYPAAAAFTDRVLARAGHSITPLARSYHDFIAEYGLEDARSVEEYTFELLNLGVLWRRYGSLSLSVEMAPFHLLAFLSEWRKKHQRLKPVVDLLRGILMSFFLAPREPERTETVPCCLADIERLVRWLEATGDLKEDAIRFVRWLAYWASLSSAEFAGWMERIMQLEMESKNSVPLFSFLGYQRHVRSSLKRSRKWAM